MSRRFWVLLLAASMATGGAMAAEPAGPPKKATAKSISDQAARLVADLGSDDYTTREQAAQQLQALGPAVMPLLRPAVTSRDPEVRRLARQVADKLSQQIEAALVLEPRRLRIAYRDIPLNIAVQEFSRATGVQIRLDGAKAERKVTFDTGYTTFWDAFDKFCEATGLTEKIFDTPSDAGMNMGYPGQWGGRRWNRFGGEIPQQEDILPALLNGQIVLTESKTKAAPRPMFQSGSLRIRALPAGTNLGRVSNFKGNRELVFGLEILPDPALAWDRVQSLHIDRAIDEQGQRLEVMQVSVGSPPVNEEEDLVAWGGDWGGPGSVGSNGGQRVPLRLRMGEKHSTVLKELSGVATIKMQSSTEALATIERILEARDRSVRAKGGSSLKIVDLQREEGGKLTIQVKVEQPQTEAPNPFGWGGGVVWGGMNEGSESADSSVSTGNLILFDARGHLVRLTGKEQIPDENGLTEEYKFTYQLAKGQPEPAKLVLEGRRPMSIHVPFTLKNVPLKQLPGAAKSVPPPNRPFDQGPISQTPTD